MKSLIICLRYKSIIQSIMTVDVNFVRSILYTITNTIQLELTDELDFKYILIVLISNIVK